MTPIKQYFNLGSLKFPFVKAKWPSLVEHRPPTLSIGARFETKWSRTIPVRAIRSIITDYLTKPLVRLIAEPTIYGLDRISEAPTPVIFAANHASHLDTPLLLTSLPQRYRHKTVVGAGADYFFDKRYKGYIYSFFLAAIPLERIRVSRRSNDLARTILTDGWSLILFPEGGRTTDGFAHEFKGGVAQLALKTKIPVIPVFVGGTYEILGKHMSIPKKGKAVVNFGYPLQPVGDDPYAFAKVIENEVARLADEVYSDYWSAAINQGANNTPSMRSDDADSWISDWNRPRYKDLKTSNEKPWLSLPLTKKNIQ